MIKNSSICIIKKKQLNSNVCMCMCRSGTLSSRSDGNFQASHNLVIFKRTTSFLVRRVTFPSLVCMIADRITVSLPGKTGLDDAVQPKVSWIVDQWLERPTQLQTQTQTYRKHGSGRKRERRHNSGAKIGDEFTLSLAKNSHFSFLPSHFP